MNISGIGGAAGLQAMQQALFKSLDADQDGQVSADEFAAIGKALPGGEGKAAHKAQGAAGDGFGTETLSAMLSAQEDRFASADTDGDGSLTLDEFKAAAPKGPPPGRGPGGPPPTSDTESEESTKTTNPADTNGDGAVSGAEMLAYLQGAANDQTASLDSDAAGMLQAVLSQLSQYGEDTTTTAKVA